MKIAVIHANIYIFCHAEIQKHKGRTVHENVNEGQHQTSLLLRLRLDRTAKVVELKSGYESSRTCRLAAQDIVHPRDPSGRTTVSEREVHTVITPYRDLRIELARQMLKHLWFLHNPEKKY